MGDFLQGLPLVGLTAPGLLLLVVVFIMTGLLVPRRTYQDALHDRDEWRTAHRISEQERIQQSKQIDELLEVGKTAEAVLRALPHPDDHHHGEGHIGGDSP